MKPSKNKKLIEALAELPQHQVAPPAKPVARPKKKRKRNKAKQLVARWSTSQYSIEHVWKSCADKKQYKSKGEAIERAKALGVEHGEQFNHYQCNVCGGFHLSTAK